MIRCHLARLLGERKLKITDVHRDTGVNRGTLTRMYYETAERYDTAVLNVLCQHLDIDLPQLLEYVEDETGGEKTKLGPRRSA